MPTTEGEHDSVAPEGAAVERTPVDHPSRRLHSAEIDDLVEAAFSRQMVLDAPSPELPVHDPYVGMEVDRRYVIEALIAAGGMGLVYRCRHRVLGKKLAIKIIRSDVAHMPDGSERFMLEAKAASSVGNEHIVDIGDFGEMPDGSPYLVMEYLEGISLAALLRREPRLGLARIADIATQIAEGLGAAHAAGIVHRDLKPDNVFVVDRKGEDFIKILDFGVARMAQNAKKLTQAGTIVGTPHYMSPEQALGLEVDHRGDIYALGIILYELLAGCVPFDGDHYVAVLHQHLQLEPPSFASLDPPVDISPELESIVRKCLAKAPEDRYATMKELARELAAFRVGPAPSSLEMPAADVEPSPPRTPLPAAPPPASAAAPRTPLPTLALPRLTGPFTLPQKRFVTWLSVIVMLGVCAVAAFRFGTSQGQRAGAAASSPQRPPPAARPLPRVTDAISPAPATTAQQSVEPPAAPPPVAAKPPEPPAPVAPSAASAGGSSEGTAGPSADTKTGLDTSNPPARPGTNQGTAPASRERREAGGKRGVPRPAPSPRPSEEFMNPWPAPPR